MKELIFIGLFILLLVIGIICVIIKLFEQTTVIGAIQWGAFLIFLGLGGSSTRNK